MVEICGVKIFEPQFISSDGNAQPADSSLWKRSTMASPAKAARITLQRLREVISQEYFQIGCLHFEVVVGSSWSVTNALQWSPPMLELGSSFVLQVAETVSELCSFGLQPDQDSYTTILIKFCLQLASPGVD